MSDLAAIARFGGLTAADLERRLGVPRVALHERVESTQDIAHELASKGAASGTLVLANEQTAGRGRMGRAWTSDAGAGLWLTMLERPSPASVGVLSLRVGLEIAARLEAVADPRLGVKWPNDLVHVRGARLGKVGGILIEARWRGDDLDWAAIGVGLNLRRPAHELHASHLNARSSAVDVLATVVEAIRAAAAGGGSLSPSEMEAYTARDALRGREIVAPVPGKADGIDSGGALRVRSARGLELVHSGTVVLVEDA